MKQDNILFLETLYLPQCRKRSYALLSIIHDKIRANEVVPMIFDHVKETEKLRGKPVDIDPHTLTTYLIRHRGDLLQRLMSIMILAGEIKAGKVVA